MRLSAVFGLALSVLVAGVVPGRSEPPRGFSADPAAVRAGTYQLDAAHGKITWTASHFGMSLYRGQFVDLSGRLSLDPERPERAALQVSIPLDKVGTFHEGLDAHLRNADFFDVPNHPTATFTSTRIERIGERQARVTGDLTLRGMTKPVTFVGTFNAAGIHPVTKRYTIGFGGEATIKRSEFGIVFAVPAIGDDVRLDLDVEFQHLE
jgi:polyisoprenoid-binding protein YceI